MQQVYRQQIDWQVAVTHLFCGNEQDMGKGIDLYARHGMVHDCPTFNEAAEAMLRDYVKDYSAFNNLIKRAKFSYRKNKYNQYNKLINDILRVNYDV